MQTLDKLVQKFWQETITVEELGALLRLLNQEKSCAPNDAYGTFLSNTDTDELLLAPEKSAALLDKLHQKMALENTGIGIIKKIGKAKFWLAAACISLVVSSFFLFTNTKSIRSKNIGGNELAVVPHSSQTFLENTGDTLMSAVLEDGSMVNLYPNSSISYFKPFIRRDIKMRGKVFFKVSKNKARPFSVYANGFYTTALGTAFTVDSKVANNISVKLFEGKVVIKLAGADIDNWEDQYLLPNQEFVYEGTTKTFEICRFGKRSNKTVAPGDIAKIKEYRVKNTRLDFNNEPMQKVLRRLQNTYPVQLSFKNADVKGLYFTGAFSTKDDLEKILAIICNINELGFTSRGKSLIEIRKLK